MGFLSHEIVRRAAPFVAVAAASVAGTLLTQRRLVERRKLSITSGPPSGQPTTATGPAPAPPAPDPTPPAPTPDPIPAPTPPGPDPAPPTPTPTPQPGIAIAGEASQGPESGLDAVVAPSTGEVDLEQAVRTALLETAPDGAGAVDVEVAGSMVVLRGRVDTREAIRELERAAAGVPGVEGVRVLLHLPAHAARRTA